MSLVNRVIYRVGFTPWDTATIPAPLSALIEAHSPLEPARALDSGFAFLLDWLRRSGSDV